MAGTAEGELVRLAGQGDRDAWDALVMRFEGLVWSIARGHRLDSAAAADVSQTVWLRLVENLDRLREPDRVGAWLAATARNECLRVLRLSGRQVPTDFEAEVDPLPNEVDQVDAGLLAGERNQELWQAFAGISERCQVLLRLLIADPPPSYDEIATLLDMAVGSIGPTRARCLEHLRRKARITGALDVSDTRRE
ncbi:MAG: RNA polymerase sigma factor [Actinomycetota bacterium]